MGIWSDLSGGGGGGSGDVTGPASSTNNAIATFNGTSGKTIQSSPATVDGAGLMTTTTLNLTNPLGPTYGGTGQSTLTTGDTLYASGANTFSKLGIGSANDLLMVSGSVPAWTAQTSITSLGTITTGTWNATAIGPTYGGTGLSSYSSGDIIYASAANTLSALAKGTDGQVLTLASGVPSWAAASGGGGAKEFWFSAESMQPLETNFAPLVKISGTNQRIFVRAFDDTTEEYVNGKIQVPGSVDTSGSVTFRVYCYAATAAASKNVAFTLGHLALNDSEAFDQAFTDVDSGDKAIDATQGDVSEISWSETVTNLGWAANDLVLFRLSRPQASANNLAGDLYVLSLAIEIPRA